MRLLFFGSYDGRLSPRIEVWKQGFRAHGDIVIECNAPLNLSNEMRVKILQRPWLIPLLGFRIGRAWAKLWRSRPRGHVDAVLVGYMGHFDVLFARALWKRTPVVLDHLVSASDTARDRRARSRIIGALLDGLDRAACGRSDICCVDTEDQIQVLPEKARPKGLVVWVGATEDAFRQPPDRIAPPLKVIFFGSYTPLQGAPLIGEAIAILHRRSSDVRFTMVGKGQDYAATRLAAGNSANVTWIDWVDPEELPEFINQHEVCLGIFGEGPKALRVVPNKVFQGAAGGAAIVTSDTRAQRLALGDAARYVKPGNSLGLATALEELADEPQEVLALRRAAFARASACFTPRRTVEGLREALLEKVSRR